MGARERKRNGEDCARNVQRESAITRKSESDYARGEGGGGGVVEREREREGMRKGEGKESKTVFVIAAIIVSLRYDTTLM